jgi:hypothetical protein
VQHSICHNPERIYIGCVALPVGFVNVPDDPQSERSQVFAHLAIAPLTVSESIATSPPLAVLLFGLGLDPGFSFGLQSIDAIGFSLSLRTQDIAHYRVSRRSLSSQSAGIVPEG